jgi:purine-binding chemotaxis protein CheW
MSTDTAVTVEEQQLVVFDLGTESYGVDIETVREIIRMQDITKMPGTPAYVQGVINLRGKVTPVVDLRARFGLPVSEFT